MHPTNPDNLMALAGLIHTSLDMRSMFQMPFHFSAATLKHMKFLGILPNDLVNMARFVGDDQKLAEEELQCVQDMPDRESFRTRSFWHVWNLTLVNFGHISRFRETAEGLVLKARVDAMAQCHTEAGPACPGPRAP